MLTVGAAGDAVLVRPGVGCGGPRNGPCREVRSARPSACGWGRDALLWAELLRGCVSAPSLFHVPTTGFCLTLKWSPPSQTVESPEVSIGCYPFAARLDGKRGEPGICHQVPGGFRGNAQRLENRPVT